eukprot:TRINITY_DN1559_c0_g1_i1.p3 TRINITY_DN1559_c0_g1~~TRINITY_DN1559_c0_g1_i1.p3  ORF type:complete len:166 (+),score=47.19 TRINITY_DN1559_c0_g1_i1:187-684(+)
MLPMTLSRRAGLRESEILEKEKEEKQVTSRLTTSLLFDNKIAGTSDPINSLDSKKKKKRTPKTRKPKNQDKDFGAVSFGEDDLWANHSSNVIKRKKRDPDTSKATKHSRQRNVQKVEFNDFKIAAPPDSDEENDYAGMGRVAFSDPTPTEPAKMQVEPDASLLAQ